MREEEISFLEKERKRDLPEYKLTIGDELDQRKDLLKRSSNRIHEDKIFLLLPWNYCRFDDDLLNEGKGRCTFKLYGNVKQTWLRDKNEALEKESLPLE